MESFHGFERPRKLENLCSKDSCEYRESVAKMMGYRDAQIFVITCHDTKQVLEMVKMLTKYFRKNGGMVHHLPCSKSNVMSEVRTQSEQNVRLHDLLGKKRERETPFLEGEAGS